MIYMDQLTEVMEAVMSVSGLKGNDDNAAGGSGNRLGGAVHAFSADNG